MALTLLCLLSLNTLQMHLPCTDTRSGLTCILWLSLTLITLLVTLTLVAVLVLVLVLMLVMVVALLFPPLLLPLPLLLALIVLLFLVSCADVGALGANNAFAEFMVALTQSLQVVGLILLDPLYVDARADCCGVSCVCALTLLCLLGLNALRIHLPCTDTRSGLTCVD